MFLRVIPLCVILCFSLPLHAEDQPIDTLLRNLLLNESNDINKIAAKMIHAERISTPSVLDELAFRLDAGIQAQLNDDLLAWYAKAFMFAGTQRYQTHLRACANKTASEKVKKYIERTLKETAESPAAEASFNVEEFEPQGIRPSDFLASQSDMNVETISAIKKGDLLNDALTKLGQPDEVEQVIVEVFAARRLIRIQRLLLTYNGMGALRIEGSKGKQLVERVFDPVAMKANAGNSENIELIDEILNGAAMEVKAAASEVYRNRLFATEVLDAAARRIWRSRNSKNDYEADAMAWLIKSIGASDNARYKSFLERVAAKSKTRKIQRYAQKVVFSDTSGAVEQFELK